MLMSEIILSPLLWQFEYLFLCNLGNSDTNNN